MNLFRFTRNYRKTHINMNLWKTIVLGILFCTITFKLFAQEIGKNWEKLKTELSLANSDSTQILAYYKVATQIYQGDPEEAKEIATKGYQLALEKGYADLETDFLNVLGVIASRLQHFDESIQIHFKVLKMREQAGDQKGMLLSLINIGNVFNKNYDPDQALPYYEKALLLAEKIKDHRNQANLYVNIGNIYSQKALDSGRTKELKSAENYLLKTINYITKNAPEVELYNTDILLSYIYLKTNQLTKSQYYTDRAIEITQRKNYPVGECYARINQANLYVKNREFAKAGQEVLKIKKIIKDSKSDFLTDELSGDFEKIKTAIEKQDDTVVLSDKDSADRKFDQDNKELRIKVREELREKYETEQQTLENKNLQLSNKIISEAAKRNMALWLGTVIILLILLALFILLSKKNKLLKHEKEKVDQANEEIKKQAEQLTVQHNELVKADRFRSRIFSVISHDLRSPIANFQALLSISKVMDIPEENLRSVLVEIGNDLETTSKMLDELLLWASEQMSNELLQIQDIRVKALTEECKILFYERLKLKNLSLENQLPEELVIQGDVKRFEFILRNIVSNAIKFSYPGKSIYIRQEQCEGHICIAVKDEGQGMDERQLAQLRRPEKQLSRKGTFEEKGTGIGLMLCHEFANRMGWHINVVSKEGLGSTFLICIPTSSILNT